MAAAKSSFLDKVLGRIGRLDAEGLQTVVKRLARERSLLETLFNTIEDGVLVVDEQGRILYSNHAVVSLLGLPVEEAEGQPVSRYLPELDWTELSRLDAQGGQRIVRHEFEVSYPRPRYLRLYAAPLDNEAAGASGLALIIHDATEARQKTFEAIESERIQALTLLAASVAHEIGNPLNALHIHLQLMERELRKLRQAQPVPKPRGRLAPKAPPGPDIADQVDKLDRYLGVARGEITRLDYIITQFLQAIRPAPPRLETLPLNQTVNEALELLLPELENRGITVHRKLGRHLPDSPFDPVQIKQVLVNLVKNAMQAMTKGGALTLATGATADGVWFSVEDTGTGISQEQINDIFKPFYTTKKKGTGLGLMIVQRIVREHGGRIGVESHPGKGATFRIWLPLQERAPRLLTANTRSQPDKPADKADSHG